MSSEIVIFDNLTEIKRMMASEPFQELEKEYDAEIENLINKTLSKNRTDGEATVTRWKAIALRENHPRRILDNLLKRVNKNTKKRYPEMYKA